MSRFTHGTLQVLLQAQLCFTLTAPSWPRSVLLSLLFNEESTVDTGLHPRAQSSRALKQMYAGTKLNATSLGFPLNSFSSAFWNEIE